MNVFMNTINALSLIMQSHPPSLDQLPRHPNPGKFLKILPSSTVSIELHKVNAYLQLIWERRFTNYIYCMLH